MFTVENLWVSKAHAPMLRAANLLDIEPLSQRTFDWFEEPNIRRGGWSGVSRIVLNPDAAAQEQKATFLKAQMNHFYGGLARLSRKRLTFEREFNALQALGATTKAVPNVLFFAKWRRGTDTGALLAIEALDDSLQLKDWLRGKTQREPPDESTLCRVLTAIARASRNINDAGWIHMGYSAKHFFVQEEPDGSFRSRVVDLEKSVRHPQARHRTKKDCSHFFRHTPNLGEEQKLHYLRAYFGTETFTSSQLRLIRKMRGGPDV